MYKRQGYIGWYYVTLAVDGKICAHMETGLNHDIAAVSYTHLFHAASDRITGKPAAEKLRQACLGKSAVVQAVNRQEKAERPPKLYDLTTLQREANRLYGYTAQQTLDYIQLLYEKKLATYPRTDSRYLTEDMAAGLPALCQTVATALPFASSFSGAVDAAQVIDNAKVSDHHAILPTLSLIHI